MHGNLIQSLQERAARALPPLHLEDADGWLLRHAPRASWWIGSVLPHARDDVARRVAHAEQFYAARDAAARFQITPGACPDDLDAFLAARGYRAHTPVSLQAAETDRIPPAPHGIRVIIEGNATRTTAKAFLDGHAVSQASAVADTGWTGIFGMATLPAARGRGAARAVLAALARWAPTDHLYLQVERDNAAAQALYHRTGFHEICTYHYRSRPPAGSPVAATPNALASDPSIVL
jgi:ribosomal protein S18 acetylase RimI-like enzyme